MTLLEGGVIVERHYSYPKFADWLRNEIRTENDPSFAVRVLKRVVSDIRDIPEDEEFLLAHSAPQTTGDTDWDRLIRAAAEMTYSDRFAGSKLEWFEEQEEPPLQWFYPTSRRSRFVFNFERTPAPFLDRKVCLGEGNLRTAKDHDRPWN